jgi:CBS domain-containing protein
MNARLVQVDINHTVRDASRLMAEQRIRHLAAAEDNKVVGLLSVRDLVKMVSVRDKLRFLRSTYRTASPSPPPGVERPSSKQSQ